MPSDPRLRLAAVLAASGLTVTRFAADVLGRDRRTLSRWLAGETIPESVADWLARVVRIEVTRGRVVVVVDREAPAEAA